MQNNKLALVVGANGVIGGKLIEELEQQGWQVVGLSRRGGVDRPQVRYLAVDLLNAQATRDALRSLT
jgi:nucleoside-diphosphate-sugar epimerase